MMSNCSPVVNHLPATRTITFSMRSFSVGLSSIGSRGAAGNGTQKDICVSLSDQMVNTLHHSQMHECACTHTHKMQYVYMHTYAPTYIHTPTHAPTLPHTPHTALLYHSHEVTLGEHTDRLSPVSVGICCARLVGVGGRAAVKRDGRRLLNHHSATCCSKALNTEC